jgi:hypothetical protein
LSSGSIRQSQIAPVGDAAATIVKKGAGLRPDCLVPAAEHLEEVLTTVDQ